MMCYKQVLPSGDDLEFSSDENNNINRDKTSCSFPDADARYLDGGLGREGLPRSGEDKAEVD